MMYTQVDVICEGALEESETFTDYLLLDEYLANLKTEAIGDGATLEVYILEHEHALDIECNCAQYVTDHRPSYVLGDSADR